MKRILFFVLALIVITGIHAESLKIGFVDYETVFAEYHKTKKVNEDLKNKMDSWQKQLDEFKTEIADLKAEFDKNENTYSDEKRTSEKKKIMEKLQEYQTLGQDLTGKLRELQDAEFKKLKIEIDEVIKNYGKKEKYSLILDRAIIYYGGKDITKAIIDVLNKGK